MGYRSVLPKFFSCSPRSHKGCLLYSLFLVFLELRFFYLVSFISRLFLCSVTSYQTRWNLPNSAFFSTHFVGDSPILVTSIYLFVFHSVLFSFCSFMDVKIVPFFFFLLVQWKVRDFIRAALYDPNYGYFSQRSCSVGVLEESIKFSRLEGLSQPLIDLVLEVDKSLYWITEVKFGFFFVWMLVHFVV